MSTQVNLWTRLSAENYEDAYALEKLTPDLHNAMRSALFDFLEKHGMGSKFVLTQTGPEIVSLL